VHLKAGDSMILRPGFKGTWEVIETTRKDYVLLSPPGFLDRPSRIEARGKRWR
jgi:hypothetical protein